MTQQISAPKLPPPQNRKQMAAALREVGSALWQLTLFSAVMDSLVVFTISFLALTLLSFPWYSSLLVLIIYGAIHTYRAIHGIKFNIVELKVPSLKERLTTVADNLDKDNEIISSLNDEVLKLMKDVRTSYFLSFGRLTRELAVMAIVSFLIIGSSAYNVKLYDYTKAITAVQQTVQSFKEYQINPSQLIFKEQNESSDIFGNKTMEALGTKELNLQINPTLSDVDITKQRQSKKQEFRDVAPTEISATSDKSYGDTIPKGYQKIVKSYFKEITKQG